MNRLVTAIIGLGFLFFLSGCASIMSGTTQMVTIHSEPPDGKININGVLGKAPLTMPLSREADQQVTVESEGYKPCSYRLGKTMNPWVVGDILIGGIIGIIIDLASGAVYTYDSDEYKMVLDKENDCKIFVRESLGDRSGKWVNINERFQEKPTSAQSKEIDFSQVVTGKQTCANSIAPSGQSFNSSSGAGSISLSTGAGCSWKVVSNSSWITITSGGSGSGNGTINFSVSANTSTSPRTANLTVAGQPFTVSQAGAPEYTLTINQTGTGSGRVSNNPTGTKFPQGTVVTLIAKPDSNSNFAGWSEACTEGSPSCSLTMNSSLTATGTFNLKTFTINVSETDNGTISPPGMVSVNYRATQGFIITPAAGYKVNDVRIDGVSIGPVSSYVFGNIMGDHVITASFSPKCNTLAL